EAVDRTPPKVEHAPPKVRRPPSEAEHAPPKVRRPPEAVEHAPPKVRRPPEAVESAPPKVRRPPEEVERAPPAARRRAKPLPSTQALSFSFTDRLQCRHAIFDCAILSSIYRRRADNRHGKTTLDAHLGNSPAGGDRAGLRRLVAARRPCPRAGDRSAAPSGPASAPLCPRHRLRGSRGGISVEKRGWG